MNWSLPIAKVKGIHIRVHVTFALVLVWAAFDWGVRQGLGLTGAFYGISIISLLFLCVTLHELGHSLVAMHYGAHVHDITLLPIGGVARMESEMAHPAQEFWMALSGPAVNLVLAIALGAAAMPLLGWRALGGLSVLLNRLSTPSLEKLLVDLVTANVGLAVFNLLPAFPMDGGRILRALLASRMGQLNATHLATRIGQGLALLLGVIGLFSGAINLMLIATFIFVGAQQEWRGTQLKIALQHVPASAALIRGGIALSPHEPLARAIDVSLRTTQSDFAVFDQGYLVGVLTRDDVAQGFQQHGPHVPVRRVMRTDFPAAQVNESLLDLQRKMQSSGSSVISVSQGGRFLGLATLESVRKALQLSSPRRWQPV